MNQFLLCSIAALLVIASCLAAAGEGSPEAILLWPKDAPGEKDVIGEEKAMTAPKEGGKSVTRLVNVSKPTITLYRPAKDKDTGASVVVCPGGGYSILAYDLEGTEICEWLNSIGVTGVLLKYRVPKRTGDNHILPLQDAQRAIGMVRHSAKEWGLDPNRIGIMGFSAGGHLSANASNNYDKRAYDAVDDADKESCRPDFAMLIYPAYLAIKEQGNKLSPELKVTANTPPTFLVQTQDDGIRVENSVFYYLALRNAKVPAEMHLYPTGGHGYGLRATDNTVTSWPKRAEEWMRSMGLLGAKK